MVEASTNGVPEPTKVSAVPAVNFLSRGSDEGRSCSVQTRVRVSDELHRNPRHHCFVSRLGSEALTEAGSCKDVAQSQADAARDHHRTRAVCQRIVPSDGAERRAKA